MRSAACPFCDEERPEFNDEQALDAHFVEECLMLTECSKCKKIIEVQRYDWHLISECEKRDQVDPTDLHSQDTANDKTSKGVRCPLCRDKIITGKGEQQLAAWKHHLLEEKCLANVRN
jgi:hypothetical protein